MDKDQTRACNARKTGPTPAPRPATPGRRGRPLPAPRVCRCVPAAPPLWGPPGQPRRPQEGPRPPGAGASPPPGTHRGCQRAAAATSRPRLPEPRSAATPRNPPEGRSGPSPVGLGGGDFPGRGFLRKESSSSRVTHAAHPDWRWR